MQQQNDTSKSRRPTLVWSAMFFANIGCWRWRWSWWGCWCCEGAVSVWFDFLRTGCNEFWSVLGVWVLVLCFGFWLFASSRHSLENPGEILLWVSNRWFLFRPQLHGFVQSLFCTILFVVSYVTRDLEAVGAWNKIQRAVEFAMVHRSEVNSLPLLGK